MRTALPLSLLLALGCAGAPPRQRTLVDCIRPRPWLTPLDAMTCDGLHVVTAHNGVFTSESGQQWIREAVDPTVRLTRLYCHQGQPWAVGFPGVVLRREPTGSWERVLRHDEAHPEESHIGEIRAAFTSLELVEGRLRAHGRTATGEPMHWELRDEEWIEVPDAVERATHLPHDLCGAREVPEATRRPEPPPLDASGFQPPDAPPGYRHEPPTRFCAADQVFLWVAVVDSYEEPRGGVLGWRDRARWDSLYLPLERPVGGVRIGDSVLLIANGASLLWSGPNGAAQPSERSSR